MRKVVDLSSISEVEVLKALGDEKEYLDTSIIGKELVSNNGIEGKGKPT